MRQELRQRRRQRNSPSRRHIDAVPGGFQGCPRGVVLLRVKSVFQRRHLNWLQRRARGHAYSGPRAVKSQHPCAEFEDFFGCQTEFLSRISSESAPSALPVLRMRPGCGPLCGPSRLRSRLAEPGDWQHRPGICPLSARRSRGRPVIAPQCGSVSPSTAPPIRGGTASSRSITADDQLSPARSR